MDREPGAVLVTGAAGFIGSTLVDRLLSEGRSVVGIDNFEGSYRRADKERNLARALTHSSFTLVEEDVRDGEALTRGLAGHEFHSVAHLAALVGVRGSIARPRDYADVNVTGTSAVAQLAVLRGVSQFVFASSSSVYGEQASGPFSEATPLAPPTSPYAATKRAAELLLQAVHHTHGLNVTSLRFFTAYGPRLRPDLAIRVFAERMLVGGTVEIYGDGSAQRDFTYVDDLVEGVVRALDTPLGFRVLNLGHGTPVSIRRAVKELEVVLGRRANLDFRPRRLGDLEMTWSDNTLAGRELTYAPRVGFRDGIRRFTDWLRQGRMEVERAV